MFWLCGFLLRSNKYILFKVIQAAIIHMIQSILVSTELKNYFYIKRYHQFIASDRNTRDFHCSTQKAKAEEQRQLYDMCQRNGYSWSFIHRHSGPNHHQSSTRHASSWHSVPFINAVSEAVTWLISPYGRSITHEPANTLGTKLIKSKGWVNKKEE